jgi:hypothetical protein
LWRQRASKHALEWDHARSIGRWWVLAVLLLDQLAAILVILGRMARLDGPWRHDFGLSSSMSFGSTPANPSNIIRCCNTPLPLTQNAKASLGLHDYPAAFAQLNAIKHRIEVDGRSRDVRSVMGLDRRGCVVQPRPRAKWRRKEPVDNASRSKYGNGRTPGAVSAGPWAKRHQLAFTIRSRVVARSEAGRTRTER